MQHAHTVHMTTQIMLTDVAHKDHKSSTRRLYDLEDVRHASEYLVRVRSTVVAAHTICRTTENHVGEGASVSAVGISQHLVEQSPARTNERLRQGVLHLPRAFPDEEYITR